MNMSQEQADFVAEAHAKRKARVKHVGTGRTNPEQAGRMLALHEYLNHGFEPGTPTSQDRHLAEGERIAEAKFVESMAVPATKRYHMWSSMRAEADANALAQETGVEHLVIEFFDEAPDAALTVIPEYDLAGLLAVGRDVEVQYRTHDVG